MPELPEAETVARTLLPHMQGATIVGARLLRPSTLHPLSMPLPALTGSLVSGVRRRGKLIIIDLHPAQSHGPTMILAHLRMTGRLLPLPPTEELHKHTRCVLTLKQTSGALANLFFDDTRTFGQLFAATPDLLDKWPFWRSLGPEPLELEAHEFAKRLRGRRPIKQALLDQKVIAGIGNIYADEALFGAGIAPVRETASLTPQEIARLLQELQHVLQVSIAQCGSSIRDYRDANGNVGAFQNSFQVYGRGGQPCKKCGSPLEKIKLGGRATVFCPRCQPSPPSC